MALPKAYRLRHRRDFSAVYQAGLRRSTANLTLRALRPSGERSAQGAAVIGRSASGSDAPSGADLPAQPARIGISISQKVSKRAVVRNRIKRQLKAILHQLLPQIAPGWQIVIVVKSSATQCGYEQFLQELKQLLRSAEVIDGY
ncbi:MAG: ribonuclease P protein component [Elainella sp.]